MEQELQAPAEARGDHAVPELEPGIREENDNMPRISKMQIELLVDSFVNDFARVATLQYTNSVGQAEMRWLGIDEGHHALSHEPDSNARRPREADQDQRLVSASSWPTWPSGWPRRPSRAAPGSLLDNTLIVWTNELGKGNSHTLNDIPFVLVGGGLGFQMGRALKYPGSRAQPAAAVAGPRHGPSDRAVRQPRLLRRRPADRIELTTTSPGQRHWC